MLKIAYIGQKGILNPSGGGVETHVEELSVRMAAKGYQVFLYTRPHYTPAEYTKYENVNLVSIWSWHTKNFDTITHTLFSTIHALKNKVDIIHYHGVGPSMLSFLPRIFSPNTKVISTAHSQDWEHSKWGLIARSMLKFGAWISAKTAHQVITVSKELQKRFLERYSRSITLIPNGVKIQKSKKFNDNLISNFNLQKNKYILSVSRLIKHKGIHYLIEAFKQLKTDPKYKDFKLVIVGQTSFTNTYFNFLKKMSDHHQDIIFAGAQRGETLEQLFSNAYLYCSPSTSEGLSISLLEAMSYAKAVLVSDITANLEITNGDANLGSVGFAFQNKNISDLTVKLKLLIDNPNITRKVGKKGKNYVAVYYNWNDITTRTDKIYKSLVIAQNLQKKNIKKKILAFARAN